MPTSTTTLVQELTELEQRFWKALKDNDVEAAVALTDFPCVVTGPQGAAIIDRQTFANMMKNPSYTIERADLSDVQVRPVRDDVAVVSYKVHEELVVEGKRTAFDAADLSVWVRRNGDWVCAAHTESILGDSFGRDRR